MSYLLNVDAQRTRARGYQDELPLAKWRRRDFRLYVR
jgi:hypothetical protein